MNNRRALRAQSGTWAFGGYLVTWRALEGHLEALGHLLHLGIRALKVLGQFEHLGTKGTQALRALRYLGTWALKAIEHSGTWALEALYLADLTIFMKTNLS